MEADVDRLIQATEKLQNAKNTNSFNTEARSLSILLNFIKVFSNAALYSTSPERIKKNLAQCLDIKTGNDSDQAHNAASNNAEKASTGTDSKPTPTPSGGDNSNSQSSNQTPNFQTPNTGNSNSNTPGTTTPLPAAAQDKEQEKAGKDAGPVLIDEFKVLVSLMEENSKLLALEVFEAMDFEVLLKKLLKLITACYAYTEKDRDISTLIENCFMFMLPCLVARPKLFGILYEFQPFSNLFPTILISCKIESIRVALNKIIMFLSQSHHEPTQANLPKDDELIDFNPTGEDESFTFPEPPKEFFLKLLFPSLSKHNFEMNNYEDYFWTLASLLKISSLKSIEKIIKLVDLYVMVIRFIKERPILEDRLSEAADRVLAGLMHLAQNLLEIDPNLKLLFLNPAPEVQELLKQNNLLGFNLIEELYNYLFFFPSDDVKALQSSLSLPKCKKKLTRRKTFALLTALCFKCKDNLNILLPLLAQNHTKLSSKHGGTQASYINIDTKNFTGFVGLKNLGCTCYINSLLQQFYMIKPLRDAILNADIQLKDHEQHLVSPYTLTADQIQADERIRTRLDENVLYHLQLVFANLKESLHQYHIPDHFCRSLKDSATGQPINVHIQQDVDEFFNTLCDKIDNELKSEECQGTCDKESSPEIQANKEETVSNNLQLSSLNELIGGSLSHEIISLEPEHPYYGEREEPYLTISVEIKNKKNLSEALDMYVKGDILEGDNKFLCEKYGKKIKVLKRCCINSLPNTLIITLKRFEFDLNLMQKVKLNDYFEFPLSLNLKPWTKAGLREKEKFSEENSLAGAISQDEEIIEHEDSYYDYVLVGVLVHSGTAEAGHYYSFIKDRDDSNQNWYEFNDNAVKPFDLNNLKSECFGGEVDNADSYKNLGLYEWDYNKSRNAYILFYERVKPVKNEKYEQAIQKGVPQVLTEKIWKENLEFLKTRFFFDQDYFEFIKEFVCLYDYPPVTEVTPLISETPEMNKLRHYMIENKAAIEYVKALSSDPEKYLEAVVDGFKKIPAIKAIKDIQTDEKKGDEPKTLEEFEKTPTLQIIKLGSIFSYETFIQIRDVNMFVDWMGILRPIFERYVPASFWFLNFLIENVNFHFYAKRANPFAPFRNLFSMNYFSRLPPRNQRPISRNYSHPP